MQTHKHPFSYSFTTCFKEEVIARFFAEGPGKKVLEMGCGSAYFNTVLQSKFPSRAFEYTGVDMSDDAVDAAKHYVQAPSKVMKGDVTRLPFSDQEFDDIIYLDVIEHVDDDLASVKEAFRVLKPGGRLIISTPNSSSPLTDTFFCEYMHDHGHMKNQRHGYTQEELAKLLQSAGFEIEKTDYSNVFVTELLITLTKLGYRMHKPNYSSQADVIQVSDSTLFKLHKNILFPIGYLMGKAEEKLLKKFLHGHCLIMLARKRA